MISQQILLQNFLKEIPFNGESDKPIVDLDHKPQTGLSFLFNQDVSFCKGNIQALSNKETATSNDFTTNFFERRFLRYVILWRI